MITISEKLILKIKHTNTFVTGFAKAVPISTTTEIQFIA